MSEQYKGPRQETDPREFTIDELVPYWQRIVMAIQAAPLEDELRTVENERDDRESSYIQGEAGRDGLERDEASDEPHVVKFPDLDTMLASFASNEVLNRLLPEAQIQAMIEHERVHLEAAQKHGYNTEIGLTITRTSEGKYAFAPFITVSVDAGEVDEDKIREHLKEIAGAPGEDMSDSDKRKV